MNKYKARICKRFKSTGIDFEESIPPAYLSCRAGTTNKVVVPARQAGSRFLGSLKGLQIRAQVHVYIQCVAEGRRGSGPQIDKHLPPSTFTGQFLRKADIYRVWCLYRYLVHVSRASLSLERHARQRRTITSAAAQEEGAPLTKTMRIRCRCPAVAAFPAAAPTLPIPPPPNPQRRRGERAADRRCRGRLAAFSAPAL
jgi:hypothetical protein